MNRATHPLAPLHVLWRWLTAAALAALWTTSAHAVPSFARQTGADCAACHVGAFGPQLTPYGVQFKLGGYTETDGKDGKVPLSGMLVANWTRSAKAMTEAPDHFNTNNNSAVQETSVFLAGRLAESVGAFLQSTYSGVDRQWALDQVDVRAAHTFQFGDKEALAGLSLNSNPTLTDPFNTLGQWRFPYTSSDFGFGQGPTPLVENLAGGVMGVNAYTLWDKHFYAEVGLYGTLSKKGLSAINAGDVGRFKSPGTYWRFAYVNDRKRDNFSIGLLGFNAAVQPDRINIGTADHYRDYGVDASYQFLGNRQDIFTVNASWIREHQTLDYTFGNDGSQHLKNTLDNFRVAASYHRAQTWGLTGALFDARGSADTGLYGAVSLNGRPNTAGYVLQGDWTPWGKETSWGAPWANVRLGLQYTGYTRYNGGSHYLDEATGTDRRARDNNTTMLFAWTSF